MATSVWPWGCSFNEVVLGRAQRLGRCNKRAGCARPRTFSPSVPGERAQVDGTLGGIRARRALAACFRFRLCFHLRFRFRGEGAAAEVTLVILRVLFQSLTRRYIH